MSRTHRRHHPKTTKWARREVEGYTFCGCRYAFEDNSDMSQRHTLSILRGDDGRIRYDKCAGAVSDNEGNWKLNTWDESPSKHNDAHRHRRRADKKLIRSQLKDMD
ncbi:MAG: hypothetical protein M0R77_12930 [Gammaproteobacteria bacterium]|nr:hypothetical protein [Gammaproteobacteria bacterium]